uniref:Uncharacterized protein n=1 Tax=Nelumbo nucifera TaxID=4432 RepID=A0A822XY75_NELNU|nr:TPA_asm: hypothetical protein HUJ06_025624 [Nelumbo nucifera]
MGFLFLFFFSFLINWIDGRRRADMGQKIRASWAHVSGQAIGHMGHLGFGKSEMYFSRAHWASLTLVC